MIDRLARARALATLLALAALLSPREAPARQDGADLKSWVGRRVITQYGSVLYIDGKPIDDADRGKNLARGKEQVSHRVYKVKRAAGPWLWIEAEGSDAKGWVTPDRLVPFEQAVDFFTARIRADPAEPTNYIARGNVWLDREEYDIAIADYNDAIRLDPGESVGFNDRGNAWMAKKDYEKAIADYDEAIRLDPGDPLVYHNRGKAWLAKGEHGKALADYGEAVRLDPSRASAYMDRAEIFRLRKEYRRAVADYAEAIRHGPSQASAFSGRGQARRGTGEYDEALADFAESARLDPAGWGPYEKVLVRLSTGRPEVVEDARAAIAAYAWRGGRPIYAAILGHLGARRVGRPDVAKAFLDEADGKGDKSLWPYPVVRFYRGEIDAKALLATATDVGKETEVRCYLGFHHLLDGRVGEALREFRWVRDHGAASYMQYLLAVAELDRRPAAP